MMRIILSLLIATVAAGVQAQTTEVPFGGLQHDASQSIEITSDSLKISQSSADAEFTGDVKAGQGTLRIAADRLLVAYQTDAAGDVTGEVHTMSAFGNVVLTNGAETAKSEEAVYRVADGRVRMTGDVLLTQGRNAIAGAVLNIDLESGDATFEGRVRTIFAPSEN